MAFSLAGTSLAVASMMMTITVVHGFDVVPWLLGHTLCLPALHAVERGGIWILGGCAG